MTVNTFCTPNSGVAICEKQELEELWTTARVAQILNRPERSVRRMVQRGEIKGFKVRGRFGEEWRIVPFNNSDEGLVNNEAWTPTESTFTSEIPAEIGNTGSPMTDLSQEYCVNSLWQTIVNLFRTLLIWFNRGTKSTNSVIEY